MFVLGTFLGGVLLALLDTGSSRYVKVTLYICRLVTARFVRIDRGASGKSYSVWWVWQGLNHFNKSPLKRSMTFIQINYDAGTTFMAVPVHQRFQQCPDGHLLVSDAPLTLQASALKTKSDWDLQLGNQEVVHTMKLLQ